MAAHPDLKGAAMAACDLGYEAASEAVVPRASSYRVKRIGTSGGDSACTSMHGARGSRFGPGLSEDGMGDSAWAAWSSGCPIYAAGSGTW